MNVAFSEPLLGFLLLVDLEEAVGQGDPVHLAGDEPEPFAQDRAADLAADDGLLDQHLGVVLPRGLHRTRQLAWSRHLADAERRPGASRLDEDGVGEPVGVDLVVRRDGPEARAWRFPRCGRRGRPGTCPCRAPSSGRRSRRTGCRRAPAVPGSRRPRRACRAGRGTRRRGRSVSYRPCSRTSNPRALLSGDSTAGRRAAVLPTRRRAVAQLPGAAARDADVERLVLLGIEVLGDLARGLDGDGVLFGAASEDDADLQPSHAGTCFRSSGS